MPDTNPLLQHWNLPPWSAVRTEHLLPAIKQIIADNRQVVDQVITSQAEHPNWDDLVVAIDEADARLAEAMGVIDTLSSVKPGDTEWRSQSALCNVASNQYFSEKSAHLALYNSYLGLAKSPVAINFDASRKASLAKILRNFRASGIELSVTDQQKLAHLNRDINVLEKLFMGNLGQAHAAWSKRIDDELLLAGLTPAFKAHLAHNATQAGHAGWRLTLDQNTYLQIMTHAQNRELREECFKAWCTRASDQGPQANQFDNDPVLSLLLSARHEKAKILGFNNFAELRMQNRMATSTAQVGDFLQQQIARVTPDLLRDAEELRVFARTRGLTKVEAWDHEYLAEQLRLQQFGTALKGLRQYFPLDATLRRLCLLSERLFGISIVEQHTFERWHAQVRLLEIREHGELIGHIYVDPFHREHSIDFAWTGVLRNRRTNAEGRPTLPIAVLYSNFTPATAEHQCQLSHLDMRVLFHEFGHCMQQILSRSPHYNLSSISRLEHDTAEFAGQLFEQWCVSQEFLHWLAAHHQTGERLSEKRINTALKALSTHTSRTTGSLLMSALLDFQLHLSHGDGRSIGQVFDAVQHEFPEMQMPDYCRYANSFDYLATGYEASMYAYKWSGVLATEAFSLFERDGVFDPATGKAFREAFFSGDSTSLLSALETFLGRPVSADFFARVQG